MVRLACDEGFQLVDKTYAKTLQCLEYNTWNDTADDCYQIVCVPAPVVVGGRRHPDSAVSPVYGAVVMFTCPAGQRVETGQAEVRVTCQQDETWAPQARLTCGHDRCDPVPAIDHALASGWNASKGSNITYTCDAGYVFSNGRDSQSAICDGNQWNYNYQRCEVRVCPEFPSVDQANVTRSEGRTYGSEVTVTCHSGYVVPLASRALDEGPANMTKAVCGPDSRWSPAPPAACQPVLCPFPPVVPDASSSPAGGGEGVYRDVISFTCRPGFWFQRAVFEASSRCGADGQWDPVEVGTCTEARCPVISAWDGKLVDVNSTAVGTEVNITCEEGRSLTTGHNYTMTLCTQWGDWQPLPPGCVGPASSLVAPEPVEAEHAQAVGTVVMGITITFGVLLLISDIPAYWQVVANVRAAFCPPP